MQNTDLRNPKAPKAPKAPAIIEIVSDRPGYPATRTG